MGNTSWSGIGNGTAPLLVIIIWKSREKPCKFHQKPVDNGSWNKYTVKACQKRCVYYTIKKEVKQNANI